MTYLQKNTNPLVQGGDNSFNLEAEGFLGATATAVANDPFIEPVNLQAVFDDIMAKAGQGPLTLYRGYQINDNKNKEGQAVAEKWKYVEDAQADTELAKLGAMFSDACACTYRKDVDAREDKEHAYYITDAAYFDFDADDLGEALKAVIKFIDKLEDKGVNPECLRIFASGSKGFHLYLPMETFKPDGVQGLTLNEMRYLPAIMKEFAWAFFVDGLDLRVYTRGRMFRRENIQRVSGKYKVPLSYAELKGLDVAGYEALVSKSRLDYPVLAKPEYCPDLAAEWDKAKDKVVKGKAILKKRASVPITEDVSFRLKSLLDVYHPDEGGYSGWFKGVAAIHDTYAGSAEGFEVAKNWSMKSDQYDLDELESTWGGLYPEVSGGTTFGSLVYEVRENKIVWIDPHPELNPRNQIDSPSYVMRETDEGFAEHVAMKFNGELKYVSELGAWAYFDGRSWVIESGISAPKMRAKAEMRLYLQKVSAIQPQGVAEEERRKKSIAFAFGYENGRKLENLVFKMQAEPQLITSVGIFDDKPYLINLINGTYDLKKDELRPHDPMDYLTQRMHVEFDPAATCPRWGQFMDEITCGNAELAKYLQCIAGLCLSGDVSQHEAYFLWGNGSNGKSVFTGIMRRLCADYFKPLNVDVLMHSNKSGQINTGLASLRGARAVATSELPRGVQLKSNVFKDLTGGDALQVDDKYVKAFTLKPQCTILVPTNFMPTITENDNGTWRRCVIIPFNAIFDGKSKDAKLSEKLERELPGILNWAIEGFRRFLAGKMIIPTCVKELTAKYRDDLNLTAKFVNQYLEKDSLGNPGGRIKLDDLYAMYQVFCKAEGMRSCITKRMFKEDIQAYLPDFTLVARAPVYRGWRIISEYVPEDFLLTRFKAQKYREQAITYFESEILT